VVAPVRQGSLDALCGVYAIVNAVCLLRPALATEAFQKRLFQLAIASVPDEDLVTAATDGLTDLGLRATARGAFRRLSEAGGPSFSAALELRRVHFGDAVDFFALCDRSHDCAFILQVGIEPKTHWTVLQEVSDNQVKLFDSNSRRFLMPAKTRLSGDKATLHPCRTLTIRPG
jgi:hypothetical protein